MEGVSSPITTMTVPVRRVRKTGPQHASQGYVVQEFDNNGLWKNVSSVYMHPTSAFAALGKLSDKDAKDAHNVVK